MVVDGDVLEAANRGSASNGAGHTSVGSVYWNTDGRSYAGGEQVVVRSAQRGWGYVIGTQGPAAAVATPASGPLGGFSADGTAPADWAELIGDGQGLTPRSLYVDQLRRRLA